MALIAFLAGYEVFSLKSKVMNLAHDCLLTVPVRRRTMGGQEQGDLQS